MIELKRGGNSPVPHPEALVPLDNVHNKVLRESAPRGSGRVRRLRGRQVSAAGKASLHRAKPRWPPPSGSPRSSIARCSPCSGHRATGRPTPPPGLILNLLAGRKRIGGTLRPVMIVGRIVEVQRSTGWHMDRPRRRPPAPAGGADPAKSEIPENPAFVEIIEGQKRSENGWQYGWQRLGRCGSRSPSLCSTGSSPSSHSVVLQPARLRARTGPHLVQTRSPRVRDRLTPGRPIPADVGFIPVRGAAQLPKAIALVRDGRSPPCGVPGLESASVDGGSVDPCGHSANDLSRSLNGGGGSTCSAASASTSRLTVAAAAFLCDRRPRRPPGAVPSDVERRAAGLQRERRHPHLLRYGITRSTTFSRARVL